MKKAELTFNLQVQAMAVFVAAPFRDWKNKNRGVELSGKLCTHILVSDYLAPFFSIKCGVCLALLLLSSVFAAPSR